MHPPRAASSAERAAPGSVAASQARLGRRNTGRNVPRRPRARRLHFQLVLARARSGQEEVKANLEAHLRQLEEFLEAQRRLHAQRFPTLRQELLLGFMCTTGRAGTRAAAAICPLRRFERGPTATELRVHLRGPLPRDPVEGECIALHVTRLEQYQGYQVKTRALGADAARALADLYERDGDALVVKGAQTYTVHHSPYTMRFFEEVPFEELRETVGRERFALVAIGERANVSPRFIWHTAVEDGRLALYHGDGLALKTYMNLRANPLETRLVLDLDGLSGYALYGTTEEVAPQSNPRAWELVQAGFAAGDWGRPSRMFRFAAERWERIAPTGPALSR